MTVVCALTLGVGCGGGEAPAASSVEAPLASGQTAFARKLGGAGMEYGTGVASCADGSVLAVSLISDNQVPQLSRQLGITRISAAGTTIWAKSFDASDGGLDLTRSFGPSRPDRFVVGIACSPLGNVFVGVALDTGSLDLGGGPVRSAVVKLSPRGDFRWQHAFGPGRQLSSFAVDGNGSVLAALVDTSQWNPWHAVKLRFDGAQLWDVSENAGPKGLRVQTAWDAAGNAIVATDAEIRKYTSAGTLVWKLPLDARESFVDAVGTTAIGTVVVTGRYAGSIGAGGAATLHEQPGAVGGAFVLAIEAAGSVRWLARRASMGPMAVDPMGRIAMIDLDAPMFTGADCRSDLVRWDLTGKELWRRPLVTCTGNYGHGHGAWGRGVVIGPTHEIWAQGDAIAPFDPGTGRSLVPGGFDWFLLRVAP
jgi:hypothetical protein